MPYKPIKKNKQTQRDTTKQRKKDKLKFCLYCGTSKNIIKFSNNCRNPDGKQTHCKQCRNEQYLVSKQLKKQDSYFWNDIGHLILARDFKIVAGLPVVDSYQAFNNQILTSQFTLALQRFVETNNTTTQRKHLAIATTNLLAYAKKSSISTAQQILASTATDKRLFNTIEKQLKINKVMSKLRLCIKAVSKRTKKAPLATTKRTYKKRQPQTTITAEQPKHTYHNQAKAIPIVPPTIKKELSPWSKGNIVLIKQNDHIVPMEIKAISANKKCFLNNEDCWYEITQTDYIDFIPNE